MTLKQARFFSLAVLALLVSLLELVSQEVGIVYAATAATTYRITDCSSDSQLQAAVTANNAIGGGGGTIIFRCSGMIPITTSLMINKTLTIYGNKHVTLDGHSTVQIFQLPSSAHASLTLTGLTVTGGNGTNGGGLDDQSTGTVVIRGTKFTNNKASSDGGAIYIGGGGVLRIDDGSTFVNNSATDGGAIYNDDGLLSINDSYFSSNSSTYEGGAIDNHTTGPMTINDSTFANNTAANYGGAIYAYYAATITGSTFKQNTVTSVTSEGGAIYNDDQLILKSDRFFNNTAANYGGALYNASSYAATIIGSTFKQNTVTSASSEGGAIYNDAQLILKSDRFFNNTAADYGGALYNASSEIATIDDTIFKNNTAPHAGGISNQGAVTISKSKLLNNSATNCDGNPLYNGSKDKNFSTDASCVFTY